MNTMFGKNNALSGEGQVFIDAAQKSNVNPLYLAGHSILETGHGTSLLANCGTKKATGEYTYGRPVYNLLLFLRLNSLHAYPLFKETLNYTI
ncbi:hypothetical protein [Clostridium estertheticum]|uniref:hypothetical protein n=1 Tax=Clostridium estertheticum TaxID=238834 RepID=UPI001CF54FA9|nr:hypothetical protein [Clostridium estertheticum]MCB2342612.1 hypothetical protein [Clostridium estertheticum]